MPRATTNLLIGGAIIMAMTHTAAAQDEAGLTFVNPPGLFDPTAYGFSQAVVAPAGARMVHISGQYGADGTGALSPDFAAQVDQAFANLRAALDGVGAEPGQVAKLTIYVVDHEPSKLGTVTGAVVATFGATLPAQTLVPVPALALPGMLFEVEAVAVLD